MGIGFVCEFLIPNQRCERLLLFVPNLNTANDKNWCFCQSNMLLVKCIIVGLQNISLRTMTKKASYPKSGIYMEFKNAAVQDLFSLSSTTFG